MAAAAPIWWPCELLHCPPLRWRLAPNQGGASCQQPHSIAIAADDQPVGIVLIRRDARGEAARSRCFEHLFWQGRWRPARKDFGLGPSPSVVACVLTASPRGLLTGSASRDCREPNWVPMFNRPNPDSSADFFLAPGDDARLTIAGRLTTRVNSRPHKLLTASPLRAKIIR